MEKENNRDNKKENFISSIFAEIRDSILFDVAWRSILFIPRIIMSIFKNWN
ncbi:hypothetical protein [Paenisporosarcina sp. TG20]|uniref:hypothetical protein n=1 Tax=Paenisporosarcina sp. TG20 TaxID=1211706 RepID=UPI00036DEF4B|nr:hypothetical protein [Paenisporosarcina sp. TG20]